MNIIQPGNGQSQPEQENPKPKGRFTGQRAPATSARNLSTSRGAISGTPQASFLRAYLSMLRVSEHTLKAMEKAESYSIAERRERLLAGVWRLASKAIDRVEGQIDDANITQATVAFGVATEKAMLLSGEAGGGAPLQINLYPGVAELLHQRYQELIAALPNGETISEPPAAMDLESGKENLQK